MSLLDDASGSSLPSMDWEPVTRRSASAADAPSTDSDAAGTDTTDDATSPASTSAATSTSAAPAAPVSFSISLDGEPGAATEASAPAPAPADPEPPAAELPKVDLRIDSLPAAPATKPAAPETSSTTSPGPTTPAVAAPSDAAPDAATPARSATTMPAIPKVDWSATTTAEPGRQTPSAGTAATSTPAPSTAATPAGTTTPTATTPPAAASSTAAEPTRDAATPPSSPPSSPPSATPASGPAADRPADRTDDGESSEDGSGAESTSAPGPTPGRRMSRRAKKDKSAKKDTSAKKDGASTTDTGSSTARSAESGAVATTASPDPAAVGYQLPDQSQLAAARRSVATHPLNVQPPTRRRSSSGRGRGAGVLFVLVLLGALIAGGLVFGRQFLFPDEWDANAREYASSVEAVTGTSFSEPLTLTAEETATYRRRVADELLGDWEQELPLWRAFGLATGGLDAETVDGLLIDRSPAIYSRSDGQVYHDAALSPFDRDAHVTRAFAEAALDQQYGWIAALDGRSLDDTAVALAVVETRAREIQESSASPAVIGPTDDAPLTFLPPVLDYVLVAPVAFAAVLPESLAGSSESADAADGGDEAAVDAEAPTSGDGVADPLATLGTSSTIVPIDRTLEPGPTPSLGENDRAVGTAEAFDRTWWWMAFASHLDAATATRLVDSLAGASLQPVTNLGTQCYVAAFGVAEGVDPAAVTADLTAWAEATAPEIRAAAEAVGVVPQLRTCDPGPDFESRARFGIARQLLGHQVAELAVLPVLERNDFLRHDVDGALSLVRGSTIGAELAAMPPGTPPADLARDALGRVEQLLLEAPATTADRVGSAPVSADEG